MTTTVVVTDEFKTWYEALSAEQAAAVDFVVALLEEAGVALRMPHAKKLDVPPFVELRITSVRFPIRVIYAFNPARQAVLVVGGNKKGQHDDHAWTAALIEQAVAIWAAYLAEKGWEADPEWKAVLAERKGRKR